MSIDPAMATLRKGMRLLVGIEMESALDLRWFGKAERPWLSEPSTRMRFNGGDRY